ncbi:hypothetical protein FAES_4563 [Fibrella aestuarina BUZ 2]|uniref:Beta-carotene 15,15'-monooxygenase n=1 Tax=Fibrella aestuarina BUZ 2 TaxID=1166018 RepID=I0KEK9_9BACT|nr:hypothetical protein [Fibrella aestuarina]CCH02562.1 hypothetical protein FAES_4563 [Fibrella aestuarina BUZ 2]
MFRLSSPRVLLLLYGIALLLALPGTYALFVSLNEVADGSRAPLQLLAGFDYTVVSDFMQHNDKAIGPALRAGVLTSLLFVLVWTWASGGLLYSFQLTAPIPLPSFWQAGTHYLARYVRLLGVTALFTLAVFLVPFLIGILLATAFADSLTERGLFWLGFGGFAVGGLGTLLVWCVADYAKVHMFRTDEQGAFRAFGLAGRFVLSHLRNTFGRYLLLVALVAGLMGLYLLIDDLLPMRNWPLILLMVVLQQAIILGRLLLKIVMLRVAYTVSGQLLSSVRLPG